MKRNTVPTCRTGSCHANTALLTVDARDSCRASLRGGTVHQAGAPLGFALLEFWQWFASDLPNNALRGSIAEYLVAQALGQAHGTRIKWDACDIRLPEGISIEVKSVAYHQSWSQKAMSLITFSVAPAMGWDSNTKIQATERGRTADVYVFCLLAHQDRSTLDVLDVDQWEFYVLPRTTLDRRLGDQKSMRLSALLKLKPKKVAFDGLQAAVLSSGPTAIS